MTVSLNKNSFESDGCLDNVVIQNILDTVQGGRALDVTGFSPKAIKGGHVIIKSTTGVYKPMPVTAGGAYDDLPADHSYVGVAVSTIPTDQPACSILVRGTLNIAATPYGMSAILSDFKTACPHILCIND